MSVARFGTLLCAVCAAVGPAVAESVALTVTGGAPQTIDLGAQTVGGYAVFDVASRTGEPVLTIEYANHPDGLGGKGDFQRETSARYLGKDFDLPVLPGNVNRHEIYRICRTGRFVAPLIQGQERYVRFHVEPADAAVSISSFSISNAQVFAAEPLAGSFRCSDERLNKLWDASVWTCRLASFPNHDAWKAAGGRLLPRKLEKGEADGWCRTLAPDDGTLEVTYEFDANPHFPVGRFCVLAGDRRTAVVQDGTNAVRTVRVPVRRGERFGLSVEKESWPVVDSVVLKGADGAVLFRDEFEGPLDGWDFSRTRAYIADGAKRDRLVWSGDLWWAERNVFHAFAPSVPYVRESILMLAENQTPEGYVQACPFPENRRPLASEEVGPWESDEFAAWLVPVAWDYLLYTGDAETLRTVYPAIRRLMAYLMANREPDGLFRMRPNRCKSLAGAALGNTNHTLYMNLLLWMCYRDAAAIADELGEPDAAGWRRAGEALAKTVRERFWNPKTRCFDIALEDRRFRIWPNAFALACGFVTADEAKAMAARLTRVGVGKMLALVLRGKFEYGYGDSALATFEGSNWFKVLEDSWPGAHCTTECMYMMTGQWWDESHPDTAMAGQISDYVLGVRPTAPGYREWTFDPHPGKLTFAEGRVPTPRGAIEVRWDRVGDRLDCRIREPGRPERRFAHRIAPEPAMEVPAAAEEGTVEFPECASDTTVRAETPTALVLDIGRVVGVRQIRLVPFAHGFGWPRSLKVETAERPGDWRTLRTLADLPRRETAVDAQTVVGLTQARYLRLSSAELGPAWVEGNFNLQFGKVAVDFEGDAVPPDDGACWLSVPEAPVVTETIRDGSRAADGTSWFAANQVNASRVKRALWTVAGLGVFEAYVNGRRVGEDFLKPGFTHYAKTKYAFTYDVTPLMKTEAGAVNRFVAEVSAGWWRDKILTPAKRQGFLGKKSAFRGVLEVEYADGSVRRSVTNPKDWRCGLAGPVTHAAIFDGEEYDARIAPPLLGEGLASVPEVNDEFRGEVLPSAGGEVCLRRDLAMTRGPFSLRKGETLVVDFGQNCAAVPEFRFSARRGTVLTVLPGEMLNDADKGVRGCDGPKGSVYRRNLRVENEGMRIVYTFAGMGKEAYLPRFTYFGCRYLSLTATDDVEIESVTSVPVSSIRKEMETGRLEVGDAALNRFIRNVYWGQISNYLNIPTDCPQRNERLGWSGDTQVFCEAGAFNADTRAFFRKFTRDLRDSCDGDGGYPSVAPFAQYGNETFSFGYADVGVIVPWTIWRQFGDTEIVRENFDAMAKFVRRLAETKYDFEGKLPHIYADWLSYETFESCSGWAVWRKDPNAMSYRRYLAACYWLYDAHLLSEMAAAIGRTAEAAEFRASSEEARAYIRRTFIEADGLLLKPFRNLQTACVFAIRFGIVEGAALRTTTDILVRSIAEHGGCLQTGFLGTSFLMDALGSVGEWKTAYDLLFQHKCPSWLYSVDQGATTVWERWNSYTRAEGFGPEGMNSFNHYSYGSVLAWIYRNAAGIAADPSVPGFRKLLLAPKPDRRLGFVKAEYRSVSGLIRSAWRYEGAKWTWSFEIPEGATALVTLPWEKAPKTYGAGRYEVSHDLP